MNYVSHFCCCRSISLPYVAPHMRKYNEYLVVFSTGEKQKLVLRRHRHRVCPNFISFPLRLITLHHSSVQKCHLLWKPKQFLNLLRVIIEANQFWMITANCWMCSCSPLTIIYRCRSHNRMRIYANVQCRPSSRAHNKYVKWDEACT